MNGNYGAAGEPIPICPRRNAWRRHASPGRAAPHTRPAGNGIRPGDISVYVSKVGHGSAKGRVLMASRYLPRQSAGKKAVALAVPLVIGAASGLVIVAGADPAIAASASVTHATPAASPATGQSPQTATAASPHTATPAPAPTRPEPHPAPGGDNKAWDSRSYGEPPALI